MIFGFIICAGKQTRFKSKLPKCFSIVGESSCLDININNLNKVCDKVFVVCSNKNKEYFDCNLYNLLEVDSNKGSGDAIYQALNSIDFNDDDYCFIQWGDSILKEEVYSFLNNYINYNCIVPCRYEFNPYTRFINYSTLGDKIEVKFKKYGDEIDYGFHDLSIFYFNINYLKIFLNNFHSKYFINGVYEHPHKEFEFLDIFNDTDIRGKVLDTKFKSFSFNTVDELNIVKERYFKDE